MLGNLVLYNMISLVEGTVNECLQLASPGGGTMGMGPPGQGKGGTILPFLFKSMNFVYLQMFSNAFIYKDSDKNICFDI